MAEFLAWLYSVAYRVYMVLYYIYDTLVDVVLHAWAWSWDHANQLIQNLIGWIVDNVNAIYAWAGHEIRYAISYAIELYNGVVDWFSGIYDWVRGEVRDAWNGLIQQINNVYSNVYNQVMTWINTTLADVSAWVTGLIAGVTNTYNPLLAIKDRISDLLGLTEGGFLSRLLFIVNQGFDNLQVIIQNPLGLITGALWPVLESMICYTLAAGMGTVKYSLPPRPSWSGGGGGGEYDSPIPEDSPGLVRPVEPLYVSGYTFNPASGHKGTDFGIVDNQPIRASHSGKVTASGWNNYGYGNMIKISGGGFVTLYAHMKNLTVSVNENVNAGQVIGYGDSTGNSTGPHLHYELMVNGQYVNPVSWL